MSAGMSHSGARRDRSPSSSPPFVPLLALDRQRAVREFDVDVALVHARQLRRELEGVPLVNDVDGGRLAPADLAAPERLNVEHAAPKRRAPRAQLEILEQAVDFPPQALERPPFGRTIGLLFGFHRRLGCNFVHVVPPSSVRWLFAPLKRNARGVYRVASNSRRFPPDEHARCEVEESECAAATVMSQCARPPARASLACAAMYASHVLPAARDYGALYRSFRWQIPARYNIGVDVCDRWAEIDPARTAIFNLGADGALEEVSYGGLREASNRLANALAARGIGRGDRVAMLLPQGPVVAVSHIAIYKLGAIALPLAMLFGVEAIAYRLKDSGARALITNAQGLAKLAAGRDVASA